jgi:hypothetical protein
MNRIGIFLAIIWAALCAVVAVGRRSRGPVMATPARLASRTIWSLENILASADNCRAAWSTAMGEAEKSRNYALVAALGRISAELAIIEKEALLARNGRYSQ